MALLTKQAVDEQIAESFDALITLSDKYNVDTMKRQLQAQINKLKSQEAAFLSALGAKNLNEINARLKQYRQDFPKIKNLSGIDLYWQFLNSIESSQTYLEDKEQQEFIDFFSRVNIEEITPTEDFIAWFQAILNSASTGTVHSTRGYEQATGIEQVILKRLTAQQKRRVKEFMAGKRKQTKNNKYTITVVESADTVTTSLDRKDWATLTKNQKKAEIEELMAKGLLSESQLNDMLRQIYSLIVSKGPSENKYFRQAVGEVIFEKSSKTKIFYGGNLMNGIAGLLGEIQALFFMKSLLGDAASSNSSISWVGGIDNPHEDLILQAAGDRIGIQVKNSYKDLESLMKLEDVSFMTRAASSFEEVKKQIGANDYQDITTIYEMSAFNIEYVVKEGIYKPGPNDKFAPSRDNIDFLAAEADRIMALFAGALMYMAVGEEFSNISLGNSVYIVGGATMKFASEILLSIFSKLENYEKDTGFKITSYYKKGANKIGNIADYFNANKGHHGRSVSEALGQMFLQSSYTFNL